MASSSLRALAGGLIIGGFDGETLPVAAARALAAGERGGAVLFRRNLTTEEQMAALLASIRAAAPHTLIALDEEGGRVSRLPTPDLRLLPARRLAERLEPQQLCELMMLQGRYLSALGFNVNFAPVLDVDSNPANPIIGDRAYGSDPTTVVTFARAAMEGLVLAGVAPCGKHFPGHGDTHLDSHVALPEVTRPVSELEALELEPYRQLAKRLPLIMTAHVTYPAWDPHQPATLSSPILQGLLRQRLGYEGAIVSDDLEMGALTGLGSMGELAVRAVTAGCDLLLVCQDWDRQEEVLEGLCLEAERSPSFQRRLEQAAAAAAKVRDAYPAESLPAERPFCREAFLRRSTELLQVH